jgi:hypothetical protein
VSLAALLEAAGPGRFIVLCCGMGAVMWLSAVYLVWRADRIAAAAIREPWAV